MNYLISSYINAIWCQNSKTSPSRSGLGNISNLCAPVRYVDFNRSRLTVTPLDSVAMAWSELCNTKCLVMYDLYRIVRVKCGLFDLISFDNNTNATSIEVQFSVPRKLILLPWQWVDRLWQKFRKWRHHYRTLCRDVWFGIGNLTALFELSHLALRSLPSPLN